MAMPLATVPIISAIVPMFVNSLKKLFGEERGLAKSFCRRGQAACQAFLRSSRAQPTSTMEMPHSRLHGIEPIESH
jgi:hypothetical protein